MMKPMTAIWWLCLIGVCAAAAGATQAVTHGYQSEDMLFSLVGLIVIVASVIWARVSKQQKKDVNSSA